MNIPTAQIHTYIEEHRADMLSFWQQLVNLQAGSKETEKVNRIVDLVKERFEEAGLDCRLIDSQGNSNILIAVDGADRPGKPLLFGGHLDTVFPDGSYPEEAFRIEDGIAYGPGVVDMKGGVVMTLYAIKALKALGFQERPIKVILVGDEEIGHVASITDKVLTEEARGSLCAFNMETGRPDHCLTVGRKGGCDCHVTVHGVAAHAGNDYMKGRNAILEMAYKIPLLQGLSKPAEGLTVNTGVIHGGTVSNAVPDYCKIELDIRYNKVADMDTICQKVREVCAQTFLEGTTTDVDFVAAMPPFEETEDNHRLLAYVNDIAVQCGYEPFGSIFVGGMSDASYFGVAGIPTVCSFGVVGSGAHTLQEQGIVESMFERTEIVIAAAMGLAAFEN